MKGILLSGGIDSSALAALEKPNYAFVVDYGQVCAKSEIRAAYKVAQELDVSIETISVDCGHLGSGDLAGTERIEVSPATEWWPYRNQLLATLAAQLAVKIKIHALLFGAVATDDFHSDGTDEFFGALDRLISMQEGNIRIYAPAISMTSAELVQKSGISHEILGWTHSCHTNNLSCGVCRGCVKRLQVLKEIGFYE